MRHIEQGEGAPFSGGLMANIDYWELTKSMRDLADKKGFTFQIKYRWVLTRKSDGATVWPHIDGYISAFLRDGMYVNQRKFRNSFKDALDRKFGDKDDDQ
jgi:hypothetical protein